MEKIVLKAEKRDFLGRKVGRLRKSGILPANIFGKKIKSLSVSVDFSEFEKVFKKTGETNLVELQIDGDVRPVLIHNVQKDPVTDTLLHVDFLQVDLKQKVVAQIPLVFVGESPAEKQGLGTVVQYINEIEVEALPADLPDKFEIDLSKLETVGQIVQILNLSVDSSKVEIKADKEQMLVKVEPPKVIVEEVKAPETPVETTAGEAVPEEGQPAGEEVTKDEKK
jgi:large subunit ribosomal protein L25